MPSTPWRVHQIVEGVRDVPYTQQPFRLQGQCCTGPCCPQIVFLICVCNERAGRGCLSRLFFFALSHVRALVSFVHDRTPHFSSVKKMLHAPSEIFLAWTALDVPTSLQRRAETEKIVCIGSESQGIVVITEVCRIVNFLFPTFTSHAAKSPIHKDCSFHEKHPPKTGQIFFNVNSRCTQLYTGRCHSSVSVQWTPWLLRITVGLWQWVMQAACPKGQFVL